MSTPASAIGIELVYEFEIFARLKPPVEVGAAPYWTRVFFEVIDGEVTGERISGRMQMKQAEWTAHHRDLGHHPEHSPTPVNPDLVRLL